MAENSSNQNATFDGEPSLLPRQAWSSQLAYLKAVLKAKQALDRREKLIGITQVDVRNRVST
ncbi:MAG TPA: hypothetical protein DCY88_16500 [Cyanobacteria bacterium UBA11372]|nr:hypothetical protein [Cyanobacteria bacterium UBA11372]